ncbi:hypothetical protein FCR2A7T_27080 [Flavobacterium cauense R2A-7]|uniref:Putative secreted protein (Por secretion system target) n=1 Tax=Flavobacterium cauense R2A-7 TaxID=1341154 RepID=V6RXV7_9FLAO|nr:T9SS type A sorting domain-containing protein [Flavobacterium cauense]ESU19283.1 hypothetical protein FCR2A7T_27080 [Flavobacterium cauense R2A-7]KGO82101.1 hypothetical protein Q762_05225 [Flavobacterium cauense R2A-7]TWI15048.1 putative secreted protein (Por secretion system target) [Flavobacterium cauense R2A-7]
MKKITLLMALLMFAITGSYAQSASTYAFSNSMGTYTEMSGAATLLTAVRADSYLSPAQNIGFTFVYEGVNYTQFKMGSNGFISLNTTGTAVLTTNDLSTANATSRPIIAPLWDDLDGATPASSVAGYEVTGSAPNRVLTVEWRNWEWNWNSGATPVISFQVKLYETTNVIEFVYRQEATNVASGSATIGIGSATGSGAGSYLNLTSVSTPAVSSTTSTTNISTKPATGQIFTFTPPPACAGTPVAGTASPVSQTLISGQASAALSITGQTTGVSGLSYQWEQSTDGGSNWANAVGGTGATTLSYTPPVYAGTPIQYRLKITCTTSGLFAYSSVASIVSCGAVTSLPWTENFDGLTTLGTTNFPSCWFKEIGDWSSSNATTYNTARSGANYIRNAWSSTNEYIWTVGFDLTAGTSYDFSTFVQGDGGTGWVVDMFYNTSASSVGATQLGGSYNVPGSGTIAIQSYAEVKRTFVPSSSGTYYFAVRVNQPSSSPWYVAFDDFKLELTPACPSPSGLAVNSITDASASITWTATSGNYQYVIDQVATAPAGAGTNLAGETYDAASLNPVTTYYFHVRTDCGSGTYSAWSTVSFTTLATPPANDDCTNAVALTPGGVYSDNPVDGTNAGATTSSQTAPTTCFGFSGGDVWYSVVVPASGNITIETGTPVGGGAGIDTVITAYSGDCAFPTQIGCDDDGATEFAVGFSKLSLTGQTPGNTILIRAYEYNNDAVGNFGISAYDASLSTGSFDSASFRAYPNPVKDMLNLSYSSDITSVEVYNMLGQNVMTKTLNASQGQIDLSNLNAGNYIVKVTADGLVKTIKVVKQ